MQPQAPPSMSEEFIRALVGFPKFALGWVIGLIIAILTDLHIASLAITGVFAGLVFGNIIIGLFAFFVTYSFSRIISYVANAIGTGLGRLADATYQGAAFQRPIPTIAVEEDLPEV